MEQTTWIAKKIMYGTLAAVTLGVAGLFLLQNQILYLPVIAGLPKSPLHNPTSLRDPSRQGMQYENIEIKSTGNVRIRGWLIYASGSPQKHRTIIFYHENAGNIGTRLYFAKRIIQQTNSNVVLVAYRGYSDSEGSPEEAGIKSDGLNILEWTVSHPKIDRNRIFVYGKSLGGAVAGYVAANSYRRQFIKALILENTFTSIDAMVQKIFGPFRFILSLGLRNHWNTIAQIPKIETPILFIRGEMDQLVPPQHMKELEQTAHKHTLVQSYSIAHGTHNEMWTVDPNYFQHFNSFLNKYDKDDQGPDSHHKYQGYQDKQNKRKGIQEYESLL